MAKYIAVQEPNCLWAVFDVAADVPIVFNGKLQAGLSERDARRIAKLLNSGGGAAVRLRR